MYMITVTMAPIATENLVVMSRDSCLSGHEFESHNWILDWSFFTFICNKIVCCLNWQKIPKWERGRDWPHLKNIIAKNWKLKYCQNKINRWIVFTKSWAILRYSKMASSLDCPLCCLWKDDTYKKKLTKYFRYWMRLFVKLVHWTCN